MRRDSRGDDKGTQERDRGAREVGDVGDQQEREVKGLPAKITGPWNSHQEGPNNP